MAEDDKVTELVPPTPDLEDPAYDNVYRLKHRSLRTIHDAEAQRAIDDLLEGGITLDAIANEVAQRQDKCQHLHSTIIREERRVECDDCGADLDPFLILNNIAEGEQTLYREIVHRDALTREIKALRSQWDVLKRKTANEKAKLKRARSSRESIEELSDADRSELERFREWIDARLQGDPSDFDEIARLYKTLCRLSEHRRKPDK